MGSLPDSSILAHPVPEGRVGIVGGLAKLQAEPLRQGLQEGGVVPAHWAPHKNKGLPLPSSAPLSASTMARSVMLAATALALCLLQAVPSLAWYKPAVGRGHYSVGRAAGLLSGLRRVPLAQRSEIPLGTPGPKSLVSVGAWGEGHGNQVQSGSLWAGVQAGWL